MALPSNSDLPNYPFPVVARTYDFEFIRLMNLCWAAGEGISPIDQTKDCTIASMGSNQATDLLVSVSSGLTMSIAAGAAWVKGDDRSTQGIYFCYVPIAQSVTLGAHHATLPRVDRIVLRVYDADVTGSQNKWEVEVIAGTATAGATLTNLNGATAVPNGCFLLANALVPATSGAVTLTDTRYFAYRPGRVIGYLTSSGDSAGSGDKIGPLTITGDGTNPVVVSAHGHPAVNAAGVNCFYRVRDAAAGAGNIIGVNMHTTAGSGYAHPINLTCFDAAVSGQKSYYFNLTSSSGSPTDYSATAGSVRNIVARYK